MGGNLDFSVYLSPLLGRKETCKGSRDVERGSERVGERRGGRVEGERREGERRKERREIATINPILTYHDILSLLCNIACAPLYTGVSSNIMMTIGE